MFCCGEINLETILSHHVCSKVSEAGSSKTTSFMPVLQQHVPVVLGNIGSHSQLVHVVSLLLTRLMPYSFTVPINYLSIFHLY